MAPPTKRLMLWKEMGGVDKLFSLPCQITGDAVNSVSSSLPLHKSSFNSFYCRFLVWIFIIIFLMISLMQLVINYTSALAIPSLLLMLVAIALMTSFTSLCINRQICPHQTWPLLVSILVEIPINPELAWMYLPFLMMLPTKTNLLIKVVATVARQLWIL